MNKTKYIILSLIGILLLGGLIYLKVTDKEEVLAYEELTTKEITTTTKEIKEEKIYVDIKGAVKKPGVYKLDNNSIINDVIIKAGGLTKNGITTNINLSKKVTNEMVIYIFTKDELKKEVPKITCNNTCKVETIEVNTCIPKDEQTKTESNEETSSGLININTGSINDLMNIPGIGESKAVSIIEYRKTNKFNSIEDIKNVSGIGDALFAKIKDYITV